MKKDKYLESTIVIFLLVIPYSLVFSNRTSTGLEISNCLEMRGSDLVISLDGNAALAANASTGNGSQNAPYIIEDYNIDASTQGAHGIDIRNTNAYFIIKNCTVHSTDGTYAGIYLQNVTNGIIEKCNSSFNYHGIAVSSSGNITIKNSIIDLNDMHGVFFTSSVNCIIAGNIITRHNTTSGDAGIHLDASSGSSMVVENVISENFYGISLDSSYNTVTMNIVNENIIGIDIDASRNQVTRNLLEFNNSIGIAVSSLYSTVHGNYINGSLNIGLDIGNADWSNITANVIAYTGGNGIEVETSCTYAMISSNTMAFNDGYGISITAAPQPNQYHNNIFHWNWNGNVSGGGSDIWSGSINHLSNDVDGDGELGIEEINAGTNPQLADTEGDHLDDGFERAGGTDPWNNDTDEDGVGDFHEYYTYMTNPIDDDTDSDGIPDGDEVFIYFCDPKKPDSDSDGVSDYYELMHGLNPNVMDSDMDGLNDGVEISLGTDPLLVDTDGDGYLDGSEIQGGSNPLDSTSTLSQENTLENVLLFSSIISIAIAIIALIIAVISRKGTNQEESSTGRKSVAHKAGKIKKSDS